ncbi:hypothetical protein EDB89DRAFT_1351107 [Lactarius sanguifluus]|nr:hypothetical protein EDB89DRAFT_1351107 [Lactarius sanguifluus]
MTSSHASYRSLHFRHHQVVPKFFGYYTPSCELVGSYKSDDEDEERAKIEWRDCSQVAPIHHQPYLATGALRRSESRTTQELSTSHKDIILGMFDRLHNARFTQKSTHRGNVLVQPGPLTHPLAERSLDNPSYRIIDFGRGKYYNGDESHFADKEMKHEQSEVHQRICDGHC